MKNIILKHGDVVKALTNEHGLVKGQTYAVESRVTQGLALYILTPNGSTELVDALGTCLDASLDVTLVPKSMELPKGQRGAEAAHSGLESVGDDGQETF